MALCSAFFGEIVEHVELAEIVHDIRTIPRGFRLQFCTWQAKTTIVINMQSHWQAYYVRQ